MGFQQGLSGLNSASKFLDVVGNNVANANTVGYKGSRAEFADIYANTLASTNVQVGIGGRTSAVAQQFSQGAITSTNNPLDIAIQGNGFFRMIDPAGSYSYARNGQFQLDREGYIVNNGQKLAGYIANNDNQLVTGATPQPIQIKTSNIGAQATGGSTQVNAGLRMGMNLDARSPVVNRGTGTVSLTGLVLDTAAAVASQLTYQTRVVDSAGRFHTVDVQLTKTADEVVGVSPETWSVATRLDDLGAAGTFTPTGTILQFTGGILSSGSSHNVSYKLGLPPAAYGTTPLNFTLNFAGATLGAATVAPNLTTNDTSLLNTSVAISDSNLDSTTPANATAAPVPASQRAYTQRVLDPDGYPVDLTITVEKIGDHQWAVGYSSAPSATPLGANPGGPVNLAVPTIPVTAGTLIFNDQGQLLSGSPLTAQYEFSAGEFMDIELNLSGLTETASAFTAGTTEARSTPSVTPSDPTSYTHSTSATVYDSQGVPHTMTMYFSKVAVNTWEVQTSFDGADPVTQPGYVTFDASGKMQPGGLDQFFYTSPIPSPSGAQTPLAFNTFFTGTTQFGSQFGVNELSQDGYADGSITGLSIGKDGLILGRYSNGQNRTIGQITLFNFANPQGLQPLGDNRWAESFASNQARFGTPGTSDFGVLQSGAVEDSNIDLTKELVDMITAQRSYQANAQTIRTQDQMLQTLVNLR